MLYVAHSIQLSTRYDNEVEYAKHLVNNPRCRTRALLELLRKMKYCQSTGISASNTCVALDILVKNHYRIPYYTVDQKGVKSLILFTRPCYIGLFTIGKEKNNLSGFEPATSCSKIRTRNLQLAPKKIVDSVRI